jgi:hypothetical protein
MFPQLISQTYTVHELKQKLEFLKQYLKVTLYNDAADPKQFSSEDLVWLNSLPSDFLKGINAQNLDKTFRDFEEQLKTLKSLVMLVPTELPPKTVAEITNKLRKDYGSDFFVDIKIDPSLIAGCALVWNGNLKDYSLKSRIEEMKPEILQIFKTWK